MLVLESLEAVPESFRANYVKGEDGKFRLKGAVPEDEVAGLKKKVEELLGEKKGGKFTPQEREELDALRKAKAEAEEADAKKRGDFESLLKQAQEGAAKREASLQERINFLEGHVRKAHLISAAESAIRAADGEPMLLLPKALERLRLEEEDGDFKLVVLREDGKPWLTDKGERATPEDLVKEFKAHEVLGRAFKGHQGHGGGARHQPNAQPGARNPWLKESFNITEQMKLTRQNPALADQLRRLAGVQG